MGFSRATLTGWNTLLSGFSSTRHGSKKAGFFKENCEHKSDGDKEALEIFEF